MMDDRIVCIGCGVDVAEGVPWSRQGHAWFCMSNGFLGVIPTKRVPVDWQNPYLNDDETWIDKPPNWRRAIG